MGFVLRFALLALLCGAALGLFVYFMPEAFVGLVAKGVNQVTGATLTVVPDDVKSVDVALPEGVHLTEEKSYGEDVAFNDDAVESKRSGGGSGKDNVLVLGRPKKVVEFFCVSNADCQTYFKNDDALCEASSGICYVLQ